MKRIVLLLAFVVIGVGAFGQIFDPNPKDNFVPRDKKLEARIDSLRESVDTLDVAIGDTVSSANYHYLKSEVDALLADVLSATFSPEYKVVWDSMTTKPSVSMAIAQNQMVDSLVANGFWGSFFDYLHIGATNTEANALLNWANLSINADNQGATFVADSGWSATGSNYISLNWSPGDSINWGKNGNSAGVYVLNNAQDAYAVFGVNNTYDYYLNPRTVADNMASRNNANIDQSAVSVTDSRGMLMMTRRAYNDVELYRNGTGIDTETDVSGGLSDEEMYLLASNTFGGATASAYKVGIFFLASEIEDADASKLNEIFERYMDAIGTGVQ